MVFRRVYIPLEYRPAIKKAPLKTLGLRFEEKKVWGLRGEYYTKSHVIDGDDIWPRMRKSAWARSLIS